jgi:hypothetical protein
VVLSGDGGDGGKAVPGEICDRVAYELRLATMGHHSPLAATALL